MLKERMILTTAACNNVMYQQPMIKALQHGLLKLYQLDSGLHNEVTKISDFIEVDLNNAKVTVGLGFRVKFVWFILL